MKFNYRKLFLLAALGFLALAAILFFVPRFYGDRLAKETLESPESMETMEMPEEDADFEDLQAESAGESGERGEPLAQNASAPGGSAADLAEKTAAAQMPVLELEARMWAHRIQGGEFTIEKLKENSAGWIVSDNYKEILFARIARLLRDGEVKPLTAEENKKLEDAKEETRKILGVSVK